MESPYNNKVVNNKKRKWALWYCDICGCAFDIRDAALISKNFDVCKWCQERGWWREK
jgi:hypothetical protein